MPLKLVENQEEPKYLVIANLKKGDVFRFKNGTDVLIRTDIELSQEGWAVCMDDGLALEALSETDKRPSITLVKPGTLLRVT